MTNIMHKAFIAALGTVALMFGAGETFARSGGTHGAGVAASRGIAHPAAARAFRQHRRNFGPVVGPFYGPDAYGSDGAPLVDATLPRSNDVRYTYTYDVPWDWAHRFPPNVVPTDRPYVSSCAAETVTVPGRYGAEQTVNITRCY
jgi:hypothetical protein